MNEFLDPLRRLRCDWQCVYLQKDAMGDHCRISKKN